jgi:putative DNA primase/helicase
MYRVIRRDSEGKAKKIHQERYDPATSSYVSGKGTMRGVRYVPYRLDEWLDEDGLILIAEGERKVDSLFDLGFLATCNCGGAGKFSKGFSIYFQDRHVVLLPDNDDAGRKHVRLAPVASSIRILELPGLPARGDVVDWLRAGGTGEELRRLIECAALYAPSRNSATPQHPLKRPPPSRLSWRGKRIFWLRSGGTCSCAAWLVRTQQRN